MSVKLCIVVLIISVFPLSYVSGDIYTAELLSSPSAEMKVGIPVVLEYKVPFTEEFLLPSTLVEATSDDVMIQLLHVSVLSKNGDEITNLKVRLQVTPVVSGVVYIPRVRSLNHEIHFPYLHVKSNLDKNDLSLKQINYYTPWIEMLEVTLYIIILISFLAYVVFVLIKIYAHSTSSKYILSNFINLKICIRKVERLMAVLKKMGTDKTRKYIVSIDCYTILWEIVHKRLGYFIDKQMIDSFTGDEIATFIISYSNQQSLSNKKIHAFFVTIDEVLYGNKQFSVDRRIEDCALLRQILLNTFRFQFNKSKKFTGLEAPREQSKIPHSFGTV